MTNDNGAPVVTGIGDGNGGNVVGGGNGAEQAQAEEQAEETPILIRMLQSMSRGMMMYMFLQLIGQQTGFLPQQQQQQNHHHHNQPESSSQKMKPVGVQQQGGSSSGIGSGVNTNMMKPRRKKLAPLPVWSPGTEMDLTVYITDIEGKHNNNNNNNNDDDSIVIDPLIDCHEFRHTQHLLHTWHVTDNNDNINNNNVYLANKNAESIHLNVTIPISKRVQFNETHIYAHACLTRKRRVPHGPKITTSSWKKEDVFMKSFPLTKHKRRRRVREEKNLLDTTTKTKTKSSSSLSSSSDSNKNDDGSDDNTTNDNSMINMHTTTTTNRSPLTLASTNKTHDQVLLYLKPSLTLQIIDTFSMPMPARASMPFQMAKHIDWIDDDDANNDNEQLKHVDRYYPILYSSEFWITHDSLVEVNDTFVSTLPTTNQNNKEGEEEEEEKEMDIEIGSSTAFLQLHFEPHVNLMKWQLMSQMEETWRLQAEQDPNNEGGGDNSMDLMKTMLLETNVYLLVLTAIISVLHTVFDMLAFKNDISFFKGKTNMVGLSLRSMIVNTVSQAIILLYLMDNDTSYMVIVSNGMGVLIEVWKITKAVNISFFMEEETIETNGDGDDNNDGGDGGGDGGTKTGKRRMRMKWEEKDGYKNSRTKEYDEIAMNHLLFVTMPLVMGYGIYSLFHQKHKGWYSWILNTLVGFIYMFGFVMMTPQLFINYKFQSVAHLNWRTMTYKSINTFIDDLFAFIIKMPIMHRLACLRDDIIFFIFLYQRYKYRTDFSRVNEFGQCEQPTEEMLKEKEEEELQQQAAKKEEEEEEKKKKQVSNVSTTASVLDSAEVKEQGTIRKRRGARTKK